MSPFKSILLILLLPFSLILNAQNMELEKLKSTLQIIDAFYVDTANQKEITEHAIRKMLEKLDPHSTFITAKDVKKMNEPLVGNFEGVGIQFNILRDTILIVATISGGPSEAVGLLAGDKIVTIDDSIVAGIGVQNSDVMRLLRGKKNTLVNVGIKRRGEEELIDFEITRGKIPLYSIDASYMVEPGIGYIRISRFAAKTVQEFRAKLSELKSQGMKSLILDLQGNQGGYLNAAIQLSDEFLSSGKDIVFTSGRNNPKKVHRATERGGFEEGNLVVMINEGSASASEIVSGAVQDWDRGLIIGRRSFGKGLVQKPFSLPDNSVIRLTIAKYYTPTGRCIQRPYGEDKKDYYKEVNRRIESGELYSEADPDKMDIPDSLIFRTPKNRIVYGGGGIWPDLFVAVDTSTNSKFYAQLLRKGVLNNFGLTYVDNYRDDLKAKYLSVKEFKAGFEPDKKFMDDFYEFAKNKKVEKDEVLSKESERILKTQIKALIARNIWDTSAYFEVFNTINDTYQKAIEAINDNTFSQLGLVDK